LSIDRLVSTVSNIQDSIELYSVWLAVLDVVKRRKLIYGYHEESFASLALHLQDGGIKMDLGKADEEGPNFENTIWETPAMIKLERQNSSIGFLLALPQQLCFGKH
jgi:hypothetical protein